MSDNPPNATKPGAAKKFITTMAVIAVFCGCSWYLLEKVFYPTFASTAIWTQCLGHLNQQVRSLNLYCGDFDERLPPVQSGWMDAAQPYFKNPDIFECPAVRVFGKKHGFGYAANVHILGKKTSDVANREAMPLTFDSTILTENAESGLETLPFPGRHGRSHVSDFNLIAYLDGHVNPLKDDAPKPNDDPQKQ
jgi:hypothetical protein